MDMYVRLAMDDDGPVVVKSAAPAAQERLRAEIERLTRAVHPGVVTVVGTSADGARGVELRTRYAGEPVSAWTGTVPRISGLGAAVAATIADLHGVGVVHGRIDESHVLVGDDGRPRLCGFSGPGGAAPADDVAGLAMVLLQLVDRASPPPGRHWRTRRPRSEERAFRQVLDRAVDPVPTRRPTAVALADAILLAVPSADLPTPTTAAPDTLDRIWSAAEPGTEAERWARALGEGPPDLTPPPVPLANVTTPAWPEAGPTRLDSRTASEARRKLDDATRQLRAEPRASNTPRADTAVDAESPDVADRGGAFRRPRPSAADDGGFADDRPLVDPSDDKSAAHARSTTDQPRQASRRRRTPTVGDVAGSDPATTDDAELAVGRPDLAERSGLIGPAQRGPTTDHPAGATSLGARPPHLAGQAGPTGRTQHNPDGRADDDTGLTSGAPQPAEASGPAGQAQRQPDGRADDRTGLPSAAPHPAAPSGPARQAQRLPDGRADDRTGLPSAAPHPAAPSGPAGQAQRLPDGRADDGTGLPSAAPHPAAPSGPAGQAQRLPDGRADDGTGLPSAAPHRGEPSTRAGRVHSVFDDRAGEETGLTIERPHLAGRGGLGGRAQAVEPAVEPPLEPRRSRGVVVGVAALAAVVVGAGVLMFRAGAEGEPSSSGPPPPRPGCPAVARPAADVDADGCPDALAVDGATVTAGAAQWTLGEPGDIAAVGDWDCDGQASAALLRPRTGDVFAFPAWAESGAPVSVQPIERVGGATGIRARTGDDGCDELVVDLASGSARSVEVPA